MGSGAYPNVRSVACLGPIPLQAVRMANPAACLHARVGGSSPSPHRDLEHAGEPASAAFVRTADKRSCRVSSERRDTPGELSRALGAPERITSGAAWRPAYVAEDLEAAARLAADECDAGAVVAPSVDERRLPLARECDGVAEPGRTLLAAAGQRRARCERRRRRDRRGCLRCGGQRPGRRRRCRRRARLRGGVRVSVRTSRPFPGLSSGGMYLYDPRRPRSLRRPSTAAVALRPTASPPGRVRPT
jgi:hypothetical protein